MDQLSGTSPDSPPFICRLLLDQQCILCIIQMLLGSLTTPFPCDWFYINVTENWLRLTSFIIPVSQDMLFDRKFTYVQKTETKVICPVLKVCCGREAKLNDHFIFLWE